MYEYAVKDVPRVIDGDTLDVVIDLGFNLTIKQRIRLKGIDTPEITFVDKNNRHLGEAAKVYVLEWLEENPKLRIKTYKDDKYGRILGELVSVSTGQCLNDTLVKEGHAKLYDGGAKT
jgi:micrococcal nuclease